MASLCLYASLWLRKIISLISIRKYICILHIKYVYIYIYIYTPIYVYVFPIENMFDPYVPMDFPILKNLEPRRTTPPGMTNRNTTIIPLILSCAVYSIFFCASYCMYYIYKYKYIYIYTFMYSYAGCVLRLAQGQNRPGDLCVFAWINMY